MSAFSSAMGGFDNGMQQGVNLYNAISSAPLQRRLLEAQAQKAEADAARKDMRPDEVDLGIIDPSLSGHRAPVTQVLPWIAAKKQGAGNGMPAGLRLKPGEVWDNPSQSVRAIPGSDLYIAQSGKHSKDLDAMETANLAADNAQKKVTDLLANPDAFNSQFGGYNALVTQYLPGDAQNERIKLESLKSDLKMAGLNMIRSGGSVGQMTEKEWPIVEGLINRLDPRMSEDEARGALQEISARMDAMKAKAADVYNAEWGNTQFNDRTGNGGQPPAGARQAELANKLRMLRAKQARR